MSYFEECLTLGQWLGQDNSRALYKFLLQHKKESYLIDAAELLKNRKLTRFIANGEILYSIERNTLTYKTRVRDGGEFTECIREMKLSNFRSRNFPHMCRFFAQSEVDVIHNFPLPGANQQEDRSYTFNSHPFYTLKYYSNGRNKFVGLINKLRIDDSELVQKLTAN